MSCLPKPVLRGHNRRLGFQTVFGSVAFGLLNASLFYFLIMKPKYDAIHEYYKNYDPEAHYKELVKYGILDPNDRK
ncbi:hypothetical protein RUM44_000310 [Polyplax serrata]|uniref:Mitochondrial cytochrome c oxidase subunit VIc/VIIs domain-containing protein n=1 Tax=Polyplax serrata TaxID=468196 RepID=A0ABR1B530_POLSC